MLMSDTLQQFIQIGIVGVFLTFLIEFIKARFGTDSDKTKALTIILSIVLGAGYYFLSGTSLWLPIIGILASATTFYALFVKN